MMKVSVLCFDDGRFMAYGNGVIGHVVMDLYVQKLRKTGGHF